MKGRLRRHFAIFKLKLLSTLEILLIQIKYNGKNVIDYQQEEDFYLTENDACDTFKSTYNSSIKLLFAKENYK